MIRSVFEHRKTAVQSGHSMSKDFTAGIIALQWLCSYYPAKVICTAPKLDQVKLIMFAEIAKQFGRLREVSPYRIDENCLKTTMLELGPDWYAVGMTTKESGESVGKFQGYKSPNLLIIVTEAQAVQQNIFDQFYGLMTGSNTKILELGNPLAQQGRFWQHCTDPRFGYNVIKLSCLDSPNVKAGRELIPGMATREFIQEIERDWGKEHPYWYGRVLGEFPQSSSDAIIPIEWIMRQVRDKEFLATPIPDDCEKVAGLDIAGQGSDETVHVGLLGPKVSQLSAYHKMHLNELVGWEKRIFRETEYKLLAFDMGGLADVGSFLAEENIPCFGVMFGSSPEDDSKYANMAAKMWWELRQAFQNGEVFIPDDPILIGQLAARKYDPTSKGQLKIRLEQKGTSRARGEASPDRADALALAWWARKRVSGGSEIGTAENASAGVERSINQGRGEPELEANSIRY